MAEPASYPGSPSLSAEAREKVLQTFRHTLEMARAGRNEDALLGAAEAYRSMGRTKDAIAHYEKYLATYPAGEEAEVAKNALEELRR